MLYYLAFDSVISDKLKKKDTEISMIPKSTGNQKLEDKKQQLFGSISILELR